MNNGFEVKVTEINRKEYLSALRWMQMKRVRNLIIALAVIFVFIYCVLDPRPTWLPLLAVGVILFVLAYYEVMRWLDYPKFPKEFSMSYVIDNRGWRLQVGEEQSVCAWSSTVKLVDTKALFLLYNSKNSSNLLPKRCLTQEQIEQVRFWYKNRFNLHESSPEEPCKED